MGRFNLYPHAEYLYPHVENLRPRPENLIAWNNAGRPGREGEKAQGCRGCVCAGPGAERRAACAVRPCAVGPAAITLCMSLAALINSRALLCPPLQTLVVAHWMPARRLPRCEAHGGSRDGRRRLRRQPRPPLSRRSTAGRCGPASCGPGRRERSRPSRRADNQRRQERSRPSRLQSRQGRQEGSRPSRPRGRQGGRGHSRVSGGPGHCGPSRRQHSGLGRPGPPGRPRPAASGAGRRPRATAPRPVAARRGGLACGRPCGWRAPRPSAGGI